MTKEYRPSVPFAPQEEATPEQWQEAREECAQRADTPELAEAYRSGSQDQGWAMKFAIRGVVACAMADELSGLGGSDD